MKPNRTPVALKEDPSKETLCQVRAQGVAVPRLREIRAYLKDHGELRPIVVSIAEALRIAFGESWPVSLELYKDPEIDDAYLCFFVKPTDPLPAFMDSIEEVSGRFHARLAKTSGHILLMPDLRTGAHENGL